MSGRLAFNLLLLAGAAYFIWSATSYDAQARQIPLLIGGLVFVLQAWITVREAIIGAPASDAGEETPPANGGARIAAMCGWMAFYFALFTALGTLAATFLFILLFLLMQKDVHWRIALAVSAATSGAIWLLFVRLMHFELYPGLLLGGTLPPI